MLLVTSGRALRQSLQKHHARFTQAGAARAHLLHDLLRLDFGPRFELGRLAFDEQLARHERAWFDRELYIGRELTLDVRARVVERLFGRELLGLDGGIEQLGVGGEPGQLRVEQ